MLLPCHRSIINGAESQNMNPNLSKIFLFLAILFMATIAIFFDELGSSLPILRGDKIVLTVQPPLDLGGHVFDGFEAAHPNVTVRVKRSGSDFLGPEYMSLEDHLQAGRDYIGSADVVYVSSGHISAETSRAGYLLDLQPLIQADKTMSEDRYQSNLLRAFQWDGGVWALPVSARILTLFYRPEAFDTASVPYPNANWQWHDLIHAARQLATFDPEGKVMMPAITLDAIGEARPYLLRSSHGKGFYSESGQPAFGDSALQGLVNEWLQLEHDGIITPANKAGERFDKTPMTIMFTDLLYMTTQSDFAIAPLPGKGVGMRAQGFAVNPKTDHPELAYKLVKYLSQQQSVAVHLMGDVHAYQPLNEWGPPDDGYTHLISEMLPHGEVRYAHYLIDAMKAGGNLSVEEVIAQAQTNADDAMAMIKQIKAEQQIAAPDASPTLPPGQIELTFGLLPALMDPHDSFFQSKLQEFIQQDNRIGNIRFVDLPGLSAEAIREVDCFYYPRTLVNRIPLDNVLLPITPLLSDSTAPEDYYPHLFDLLSHVNDVFGYPLTIGPNVVTYDPEQLQLDFDWDWGNFMRAIYSQEDDPSYAFSPANTANTHILMLAASQGLLIYDYRQNPPTLNLNDAGALMNVLDLAKDGLMFYTELGSGVSMPVDQPGSMKADGWDDFWFKQFLTKNENLDLLPSTYQMIGFPEHDHLVPLSYDVGAGYVSFQTPYPESCFRFIQHLETLPELMMALPAKVTSINALEGIVPTQILTFYKHYAEALRSRKAVYFPTSLQLFDHRLEILIENDWLNQAFDAYVLDAASLEAGINEAQDNILAFRACYQEETDRAETNHKEIAFNCGVGIDPTLETKFKTY